MTETENRELENITSLEKKKEILLINQNQDFNYDIHKTRIVEVSKNLVRSIREISRNSDREYSINIIFEKKGLKPEVIVFNKGGMNDVIVFDQFDFTGHTHSNEDFPIPSRRDLDNLRKYHFHFIIGSISGKGIILTIENEEVYDSWKKDPKEHYEKYYVNLENKIIFFYHTGIRVYKMPENFKLEIIDCDYIPKIPKIPQKNLEKYAIEFEFVGPTIKRFGGMDYFFKDIFWSKENLDIEKKRYKKFGYSVRSKRILIAQFDIFVYRFYIREKQEEE